MNKKIEKTTIILFASLIVAITLAITPVDFADAYCTNQSCGEESDLRIMADYETPGWWATDHHLSNYWTYVGEGESGTNTVTATADKSGYVFPSFVVKSNSVESKTATYTVSYQFIDESLGLTHTQSRTYTEVFSSYLDGEADRFTALSGGIDKGDKIIVTLTVSSIS